MPFLKYLNYRLRKVSQSKKEEKVDSLQEEKKSFINTIDDDCWEMIFKLVREDDSEALASISLVNKRFLYITNRMKTSLNISDLVAHQLTRALRRFRDLKSISIDTKLHKDVDYLVSQIAISKLEQLEALELLNPEGLPREGLSELGKSTKGLKKLRCIGTSLCDEDLVMFTDLFPSLEEVSSNCFGKYELVSDQGIRVVATRLKMLSRISLCDCGKVTDEAIMSLSSNCKDLTGVEIQYCRQVTENGIGFLMRHSPKLTSLALFLFGGQSFSNDGKSQYTMQNSISYATNLEEIQLWQMDISDDFLCLVAKSCPSLRKIDLDPRSQRLNFAKGLVTLSKDCLSLKEIYPRVTWLTDVHMLEISEHLTRITHINLSHCANLTTTTLFLLAMNCPLLESLVMDDTKIGTTFRNEDCILQSNYKVNHLSLRSNKLMNDQILLMFASVFPYLEYLNISFCGKDITDKVIAGILRVCPKIKHLIISKLTVSNFLRSNKENSELKLKTIKADQTGITDEALVMVGERCPHLEELDLGWCKKVTGNGLELIVSKCRKLKKINMKGCDNVDVNILDWMVATRPSLQEIVPPRDYVPSKQTRNIFLAKGCLVLNGGGGLSNKSDYLAEI